MCAKLPRDSGFDSLLGSCAREVGCPSLSLYHGDESGGRQRKRCNLFSVEIQSHTLCTQQLMLSTCSADQSVFLEMTLCSCLYCLWPLLQSRHTVISLHIWRNQCIAVRRLYDESDNTSLVKVDFTSFSSELVAYVATTKKRYLSLHTSPHNSVSRTSVSLF